MRNALHLLDDDCVLSVTYCCDCIKVSVAVDSKRSSTHATYGPGASWYGGEVHQHQSLVGQLSRGA